MRLIAIIAVAIAGVWLVGAPTLANVVRPVDPQFAMRLWPWNGNTRAAYSQWLAAQPQPERSADRILAEARAALMAEPAVARNARMLGVGYGLRGEPEQLANAMRYAESMSRRDLPTEMWSIEDAVARGNVAGALVHYDHALRSNESSQPLLLPILVKAAEDPALLGAFVRLMRTNPPWRSEFMVPLIADGLAPVVSARLVAKVGSAKEVHDMILRLTNDGEYAVAAALFETRRPSGTTILVRGSRFDKQPEFPPFDWVLNDGDGVSTGLGLSARDRPVLRMSISSEGDVVVARQLLRLTPGHYKFSTVAGEIDQSTNLAWQTRCVSGKEIVKLALRGLAEERAALTVPSGCDWQWLELIGHGEGSMSGNGEVERIEITRVDPSQRE